MLLIAPPKKTIVSITANDENSLSLGHFILCQRILSVEQEADQPFGHILRKQAIRQIGALSCAAKQTGFVFHLHHDDGTGKTFSELMKIFRIRKACELLTGSGMDIHEISELLGYANPESFMLAFKKEMGLTPTQYRRGQ